MKTYAEGSVFVVEATDGTVYVQFVRKVERSLELIRVLPGIYNKHPDLERIVSMSTDAWHLLPIRYLARRRNGEVEFVDVFPVPDVVPNIMLNQRLRSGEYLVVPIDGTTPFNSTKKVRLTEDEIQQTPQLSLVNLAFIRKSVSEKNSISGAIKDNAGKLPSIRHFLYFSSEEAALAATNELKAHYDLTSRTEALDEGGPRRYGIIVVDSATPQDIARYTEVFEHLCSMFDGEYDGWEQSNDADP